MNLKEPGAVADVVLSDLVGPADDGGAAGPGHAKVVGLPQPPDDRDVVLEQEVLRKVRDALLGDHLVGRREIGVREVFNQPRCYCLTQSELVGPVSPV